MRAPAGARVWSDVLTAHGRDRPLA